MPRDGGCGAESRVIYRRLSVVLSLTNESGPTLNVTSSAADGSFLIKAPAAGTYQLKAELMAFAPVTRRITIDGPSCQQRVALEMALASRTRADAQPAAPAARAALPSRSTAGPSVKE